MKKVLADPTTIVPIIAALIAFLASVITMLVSILSAGKNRRSDESFRRAEMDHQIRMANRAQVVKLYSEASIFFCGCRIKLEEIFEAEGRENRGKLMESALFDITEAQRSLVPVLEIFSSDAVIQTANDMLDAFSECYKVIVSLNDDDELLKRYRKLHRMSISKKYSSFSNTMKQDLRVDLR